jgi:peptide-methionine (S)-S-oxide reductase
METATFAGGCFWCTEAIFQRLKGVKKVTPGYSGGETKSPTYEQVSSGVSGHAEAIQITFDPKVISYQDLLDVFFATHDPTTLNHQGADVGSQYRSAIFYADEAQKKLAEAAKSKIPNAVTEIAEFTEFTEAEGYHKNYYDNNRGNVYCKLVIDPKVRKLMKEFKDKVKPY